MWRRGECPREGGLHEVLGWGTDPLWGLRGELLSVACVWGDQITCAPPVVRWASVTVAVPFLFAGLRAHLYILFWGDDAAEAGAAAPLAGFGAASCSPASERAM